MSHVGHPLSRAVLLVFAAWSLCVLMLVESGLGGRWSLHPDSLLDASKVPEVRLLSGAGGVDGFERYQSIIERPLFSDSRRPPVPETAAEEKPPEPVSAPLNVVVTSIVITKDRRIAIVTYPESKRSQAVSVGSALEGDQSGWRLTELQPRRAVFSGPGGARSDVDLRVFDGTGGEPPTPIAAAAPQRGRGAPVAAAAPATDRPAGEQEAPGSTELELITPESRAELIRRRIEERRQQMREEAERAKVERGQ